MLYDIVISFSILYDTTCSYIVRRTIYDYIECVDLYLYRIGLPITLWIGKLAHEIKGKAAIVIV